MAKLILTTVLVVALAGAVQMQQVHGQAQGYAQGAMGAAADVAQNLPAQMQNQLGQGMNSLQNQAQQPGGMLSGLLGGSGNMNSNSGPFETLRQLPARGLQMLNNVFSGVRNMLPLGLGRNSNNQSQNSPLGQLSPDQLLQNLPKNPITDMAQGLLNGGNNYNSGMNNANNGLRLPNLNQITNPITEPLQQGRLPDLGEITRGAQNTVRDLTSGLGNTLNGARNQAQGQAQGGLGGLLSNLGATTSA